jgi:formamidopyrimidine-DNA glycosylase
VPELPEVEVVRSGLEPAVTEAIVVAVEVFEPRSLRRHDSTGGGFVDLLEGSRMTAAVRRGKFLWIPIISGPSMTPSRALVTHLGMSGQVLLREPGTPDDAQLRIRLHLDNPLHGEIWMNFVDQRIFGSMSVDTLVTTEDGVAAGFGSPLPRIPRMVAHIARDPLDPAFDDEAFFTALLGKKTGIKRALLDQTLISGIGNIYADESLWAARVHYAQPGVSLSRDQAGLILAEVRLVLMKALAEGGTSFDSQYVNVNGVSGYFSHSLTVYGQQGNPCPRCGRPIVREQFMNRSSHFCEHCQAFRSV